MKKLHRTLRKPIQFHWTVLILAIFFATTSAVWSGQDIKRIQQPVKIDARKSFCFDKDAKIRQQYKAYYKVTCI